ncbi:hypothetical protein CR513_53809, partial [Mucuna pruriens]
MAKTGGWVEQSFKALFKMTYCSPDERVCHSVKDESPNFIYMYETTWGLLSLFDSFAAGVLWMLGVTPTQLHPNGWASMQAFCVVCWALSITPTAPLFRSYYTTKVGKQVGWNLSLEEKFDLSLLEELPRGMSCKELVIISFNSNSSKLFRDLLKR